jgi:hypothetical protein
MSADYARTETSRIIIFSQHTRSHILFISMNHRQRQDPLYEVDINARGMKRSLITIWLPLIWVSLFFSIPIISYTLMSKEDLNSWTELRKMWWPAPLLLFGVALSITHGVILTVAAKNCRKVIFRVFQTLKTI